MFTIISDKSAQICNRFALYIALWRRPAGLGIIHLVHFYGPLSPAKRPRSWTTASEMPRVNLDREGLIRILELPPHQSCYWGQQDSARCLHNSAACSTLWHITYSKINTSLHFLRQLWIFSRLECGQQARVQFARAPIHLVRQFPRSCVSVSLLPR